MRGENPDLREPAPRHKNRGAGVYLAAFSRPAHLEASRACGEPRGVGPG
jgi:hypothetical protein